MNGTSRAARLLAALIGLLAVVTVSPPVSVASGASSPRVQVVDDPRGDVIRKEQDVRGAYVADVTRVRYRTPFRIGGELRITSRWVRLWDGRRKGSPVQSLMTEFVDPRGTGSWTVYVDNDGDVYLEDYTGDEGVTELDPRRAEVDFDFGLDGRIDLRLSTEWMRRADPRRIAFTSWGGLSSERPRDPVAESRPLLVGPSR